jgi:spermidine synthase
MVQLLLIGLLHTDGAAAEDRLLAHRKNRWGEVAVQDLDGVRHMVLDGALQTSMDLAEPDKLIHTYTQLIVEGLAVLNPQAQRAVVVGLGGGTLCRHLVQVRPDLELHAVEINRAVVRLARRFFEVGAPIQTHVADGRAFLERRGAPFDVIVLDAAGENYVPPSLMTVEFLRTVRARLAPGGVVIANSWGAAPYADHELATWQAAFGPTLVLSKPADAVENRVLMATRDGLDAQALGSQLGEAPNARGIRHRPAAPPQGAVVLTDANVETWMSP